MKDRSEMPPTAAMNYSQFQKQIKIKTENMNELKEWLEEEIKYSVEHAEKTRRFRDRNFTLHERDAEAYRRVIRKIDRMTTPVRQEEIVQAS